MSSRKSDLERQIRQLEAAQSSDRHQLGSAKAADREQRVLSHVRQQMRDRDGRLTSLRRQLADAD